MALPIRFQPPHRDPRDELHTRLQEAPEEHAEALLAVYDILQGLHDRGILAALKRSSQRERFFARNCR